MSTTDTNQTTLNSIAASIETLDQSLTTAAAAIKSEIATLQAANPGLDFTNLNQAVTDLETASAAVSGIVPATPAPPAPTAAQAYDPGTNLPLYSYTGPVGGTVPSGAWTQVTDATDANGGALWTFASDTAGGQPTGAAADWVPYTGSITTPTTT